MAVNPNWQPLVRTIADGESVNASVANRPINDLAARTDYLKARIDSVRAGQAIIDMDASLASDTYIGAAVYRASNGTYKLAIANVEEDTQLGHFVLSPSSIVVGVVISKSSSTVGYVGLFGKVDDIDMSGAIEDDDPEYGQYYLSSRVAGKITRQKPAVGIPVCVVSPDQDEVFINAALRDVLEDHTHVKVHLYATPAGYTSTEVNGVNQQNPILLPDVNGLGWLPANHAVFDGKAPAGARFGYNISTHTELSRVWPLLPLDSCYMELDGVGLPIGTSPANTDSLVIVDRYGIWWMDDCYGSCPWQDPRPVRYNPNSGLIVYSSQYYTNVYDVYYGSCGHGVDRERQLILYGTKMVYKTDATVVTSLESVSPSIVVQNCNGTDSKVGALQLDLDLQFTDVNDTGGYQVVKAISGEQLFKGPVVSSIRSSDNSVAISGNVTDPVTGRVYGDINIQSADSISGKELELFLVRLEQTTEESYQNVPFLGFPTTILSSMRLKTVIPGSSLVTGTLALRAWFLGTTVGALPTLQYSYRTINRPANQTTSLIALPTADSADIAIPLTTIASAYQYFERQTAGINVTGGDIVLFTIKRPAADAYSGMVGLLKIVPVFVTA